MIRKYWLLLCFVLAASCLACGCSAQRKQEEEENKPVYELNERQKKILEENKLSTEYEELSYSQKQAIKAIEEMLQVLEEKYDEPFAYESYAAKSVLENEWLVAYPCSGKNAGMYVKIERRVVDGEEVYVDDYMNLQIRRPFNAYVTEFATSALQTSAVKVYSDVETTLETIPDSYDKLKGKVAGDVLIFIDNAMVSEESVDAFVVTCGQWMRQQEFYGLTQVVLLKDGSLTDVTGFNYTDYLREENYLRREKVWINK